VTHAERLPHRHDHRSVLFVSIVAALGGLLFGYEMGVMSGALLFIESSVHLGSAAESVVVSAVLVGAVRGAGLAMRLGDRVRRRTLILPRPRWPMHTRSVSWTLPYRAAPIPPRRVFIALLVGGPLGSAYAVQKLDEMRRREYPAGFQFGLR
jgi:MFS family permease